MSSLIQDARFWGQSWLVGAPLIALTVVVHVFGLGPIRAAFARAFRNRERYHRFPLYHVALVMCFMVTLVTGLHVVEATIWVAAFLLIGAIPNTHAAMLYSISAMTTYG